MLFSDIFVIDPDSIAGASANVNAIEMVDRSKPLSSPVQTCYQHTTVRCRSPEPILYLGAPFASIAHSLTQNDYDKAASQGGSNDGQPEES